MTSPVIESFPTGASGPENIDTGFPFDSDDAHFRTELEDIALRHPEFAEHLNPASHRRANNTDRFRSQDPFADYRSTAREWPFGSRFQQFGFPFTSDFDEDPLIQQRQYQSQAASERPPDKQEEKVNEKPPQPPQKPTEERSRRNIQQSNTVDLGQKQETVDDNSRNQRSMSAPPENRNASNKRFVSSINIPNFNQPSGDSSMGGRMSQPETPPQQNKPTERIIPIHIEGRDVPIIPKNVNISGAPQPERGYSGGRQMPETERIFGQRPSTFTQYVNKDADAERQREELAKQQQEYQRQQQEYQKQQQQEYQKQQQQEFQKQQQQQQQEAHKATPPPEQKPTPLDLILNIQKDVSKLMEDVAKFEGKPRDKQYLYLDEMLTRNMLKLDNIETEGKDAIRQARKEAIKCIEQCIQVLESKANANKERLERMEVEAEAKPAEEAPKEEAKTEAMEVEPVKPAEDPKDEAKVEEKTSEETKKIEEKAGGDETNKPAVEEEKKEENAKVAQEENKPAAEEKKEVVKDEKSEPSQEESKPDEKKKGKKKSESK